MRRGELWRDPDFRKMWYGQAVSEIGSRISREGIPLTAVLVLGASPLQMGLLNGTGALAVVAFGLFAGVWTDRLPRRPILITTDLARAAVLLSIPIAAVWQRLTIVHLLVAAAAAAALTILFDVAYQAYLPSLVERDRLLEGNSMLALNASVAEVIGPGLTGVLVQLLTAPIAILFDAVSFLFSALCVGWIKRPEPRSDALASRSIPSEIAEGLRGVWREPVLRTLAERAASSGFFLGVSGGLYVLFAVRELGLNPAQLGLVIAAGGVANLIGATVTKGVVRRLGLGPTLIAAAIAIGCANLLVPLARGPVWLCTLLLVAAQLGDVVWPIYTVSETSLRQTLTPNHLLGRVNAAMLLLFRGALPIGAFAGGAVAQLLGLRTTLFIGASGVLLSTLWLVCSPVRRLRDVLDAAARGAGPFGPGVSGSANGQDG